MERMELTLYDSDMGCRVISYDVDAEGKVSVVGTTRMDSRQSDDPPCPYCGEIECVCSEIHDDDEMFLEEIAESMFDDFKAKSWSDNKDTDDLQKAVDEYLEEQDVPF